MDTMQKVVLIGHTLIAVLIIVLVLMQRGKGADAGAAFGAGASGTVFGSRGSSSFFSRATAILATVFFVSSLTLAYLSSQRTAGPSSLLDEVPAVESGSDAIPADAGELPRADLPATETLQEVAGELPTLDEEISGEVEVDDQPSGDDTQ